MVYKEDPEESHKFEKGTQVEVWCKQLTFEEDREKYGGNWIITQILDKPATANVLKESATKKVGDLKVEVIDLESDPEESEPSSSSSAKNNPKFQEPQNWTEEKARLLHEIEQFKTENVEIKAENAGLKAQKVRSDSEIVRFNTENGRLTDENGRLSMEIDLLKAENEQLRKEKVS